MLDYGIVHCDQIFMICIMYQFFGCDKFQAKIHPYALFDGFTWTTAIETKTQ